MVKSWTREREMRGDGGNHHETRGLKIVACVSQFTIPDTACISPDPTCNYTDKMSSKSIPASPTTDYSYPLQSSPSFSSSSPISRFLVYNSTIIAEHKVTLSLSISPCHDHELAPSIASTEYSIHRVQQRSKIVCLPFILMITR
jgi:hypothetical protein